MSGVKRQTVLLSLIEKMKVNGSWCGETHIQKCGYFLQELLSVPLGFEYILYKHGPFSFDLRDELGLMRSNMIIELINRSPFGSSISPGDAADSLKQMYPKTSTMYTKEIDFIVNKFANFGVAELERLATAFYVTTKHERESNIERAKILNKLKPHVSLGEAKEAITSMEAIMKEAECVLH
ncbi:MAG: hypothetical protein GX092_03820 [Clostridia bacterium]|nr:hypothetical protein [Clostridia bacterium]